MKIEVNHTYEAKKPRRVSLIYDEVFNDRMVLWVGAFELQYDSPTVKRGRSFPRMKIADFEEWAGRDVTDSMPKGDWRPYKKS